MQKNLSDDEIISRCLENLPEAWDEFFRRFIPDIKSAIRQKLRSCGRTDLERDIDVIWDIHQEIVINLYRDNKLRYCADPSHIGAWLKEVTFNQTIDWLRRHSARKRLPERVDSQSSLSLSAPLRGSPEITLEEIMPAPLDANPEVLKFLQRALNGLENIDNSKSFWVLRLSIIAYLPLSPEESQELASYRGEQVARIAARLDRIFQSLAKKEEKNRQALGQAVILWHEIRRLEARLGQKAKELGENVRDLANIQRLIDKKTKLREQYLRQGQSLCRPSNRDLAEIVGLPIEKAGQISNILSRARQLLWEKTSGKDDF